MAPEKNLLNGEIPSLISSESSSDQSCSQFSEDASDTMSVCSSTASSKYADLLVAPHVGHKKVLVTGGAGFVGSSVAEALLARGDDVVIVDEMNDYYDVTMKESNLIRLQELYPEEGRLVIYRGNICDMPLMQSIFENERPQWVCHRKGLISKCKPRSPGRKVAH